MCSLCKNDAENVDHILLHCNFVSVAWAKIFNLFSVGEGGFPHRWADFIIITWHFSHSNRKIKAIWRFALLALAWSIWMERNRGLLEDISSRPQEIWGHTRFLVGLWAKASNIFDSSDHFLFYLECGSFLDL